MSKKNKSVNPLTVGSRVIIRTVSYHYTGVVLEILDTGDILLDDAAWIADSGRWADALATGRLSEVEPYPGPCLVMRGAICDVAPWAHALPRQTL